MTKYRLYKYAAQVIFSDQMSTISVAQVVFNDQISTVSMAQVIVSELARVRADDSNVGQPGLG